MRLFVLDIARYSHAGRRQGNDRYDGAHMDKSTHIRTPLDIHILNGQV